MKTLTQAKLFQSQKKLDIEYVKELIQTTKCYEGLYGTMYLDAKTLKFKWTLQDLKHNKMCERINNALKSLNWTPVKAERIKVDQQEEVVCFKYTEEEKK